jgi:hypothetical protein
MYCRCLAVVYNQTTGARFADGSSTKGRARPVRVIRAGPSTGPQPRLTVTIHCYLSNQEKDFFLEYISFAKPITEQMARVTAITGEWFHPDEPANPQSRACARMILNRPQHSLPSMSPDVARGLIEQASVGQYFMIVYAKSQASTKKKASKARPATTYADGSQTDSVRPRPIRINGYFSGGGRGATGDLFSVQCLLSRGRKKFLLHLVQWAENVEKSVAEGEGCSGGWLPSQWTSTWTRGRKRNAVLVSGGNDSTAASKAKKSNDMAGPGATIARNVSTGATAHKQHHSKTSTQPTLTRAKPHPGVSWDKIEGKWRARVGYKGQIKFLGYFRDWEDAVAVVDQERDRLKQLS